jgi:hypothetical protein
MSDWPSNITRARVSRFNLVFGVVCLALAALYLALSLAGAGGATGFDWFPLLMFGGLGVLALFGVWAMRRDDARRSAR